MESRSFKIGSNITVFIDGKVTQIEEWTNASSQEVEWKTCGKRSKFKAMSSFFPCRSIPIWSQSKSSDPEINRMLLIALVLEFALLKLAIERDQSLLWLMLLFSSSLWGSDWKKSIRHLDSIILQCDINVTYIFLCLRMPFLSITLPLVLYEMYDLVLQPSSIVKSPPGHDI